MNSLYQQQQDDSFLADNVVRDCEMREQNRDKLDLGLGSQESKYVGQVEAFLTTEELMIQIPPECTKTGFNPYTAGEGEKLPTGMSRNAERLLLNSFPVVANISLDVLKSEIEFLQDHTLICRFLGVAPTGTSFWSGYNLCALQLGAKK